MALRPEGKEKTLNKTKKMVLSSLQKEEASQLPAGRIKLKTDGCAKGSPGPPGIGGIARDDQGRWLFGFCGHMAKASSLAAELWAIERRLMLLKVMK